MIKKLGRFAISPGSLVIDKLDRLEEAGVEQSRCFFRYYGVCGFSVRAVRQRLKCGIPLTYYKEPGDLLDLPSD